MWCLSVFRVLVLFVMFVIPEAWDLLIYTLSRELRCSYTMSLTYSLACCNHTHVPFIPLCRCNLWSTLQSFEFLNYVSWSQMTSESLKARSHGAIFNDCDCVFLYRMYIFYIACNGLYWCQWHCSDCAPAIFSNLIKKRSRTQKKTHRVNRPLLSCKKFLWSLPEFSSIHFIIKL